MHCKSIFSLFLPSCLKNFSKGTVSLCVNFRVEVENGFRNVLGLELVVVEFCETRHFLTDEVERESLAEKVIVEFFRIFSRVWLTLKAKSLLDRQIDEFIFRQFGECRVDRRIERFAIELLL